MFNEKNEIRKRIWTFRGKHGNDKCKWKVGIDVMMKLCQRAQDGKRMPEDWKTSVMVPIYEDRRCDKLWSI